MGSHFHTIIATYWWRSIQPFQYAGGQPMPHSHSKPGNKKWQHLLSLMSLTGNGQWKDQIIKYNTAICSSQVMENYTRLHVQPLYQTAHKSHALKTPMNQDQGYYRTDRTQCQQKVVLYGEMPRTKQPSAWPLVASHHFPRSMPLIFLPWRWRQYQHLKLQYLCSKLDGLTQKTKI